MNTSENIQNTNDDIIINLKALLWESEDQIKDQGKTWVSNFD